MKRLILVGGGHAHLSVLRALSRERPIDVEVVLVTPSLFQSYSGMLPGWVAGHYAQADCQIDLQALVQSAGVRMVTDRIVGMDAKRRCIGLPDGKKIEYDFLSLDVGSEVDLSWLAIAGNRLLPVKPLDRFFESWPQVLSAAAGKPGYRLAVIGGGAAGVELALAARYAFTKAGVDGSVNLVVSESGPLVGHAASVQRRIVRLLAAVNVNLHRLRGAGAEDGVLLSDGTLLPADCVIAATGARAPAWLKLSGLTLDEYGYIAVDGYNRSVSHPGVFAVGDVCSRQDLAVGRSGVHAVRAGPVLAENLLAALLGGSMRTYYPSRQSLYLLACGSRYAVASWGRWSAEGAWVWRWKDWIDRGFIRRFSESKRGYVAPPEKEIS
jgi:pyridine nucleotide-disulfide oxidoreductase family protein